MISTQKRPLIATVLTALLAGALLTATTPRVSQACGYYSEEDAARSQIYWLFGDSKATTADLEKRFPELSTAELGHVTGRTNAKARTRWIKVNGNTANALVQVTSEVPGCRGAAATSVEYFKVSMLADQAYSWLPTSIERAQTPDLLALMFAENAGLFTQKVAIAASAKLATR